MQTFVISVTEEIWLWQIKKQTQILLINDMAGYGKVALSVMIPVLSHLRFETFNLPTALVSTLWIMVSLIFWIQQNIWKIRFWYGRN